MSQVPQVPQAGPVRPQGPSEESKPSGKTSEKFTRLIKEVESTDAEKQGKRRQRPKVEEEPEVIEQEPSVILSAAPAPNASTAAWIPELSPLSMSDEEALTGLGPPAAFVEDEDWEPAPSTFATTPPPPAPVTEGTPSSDEGPTPAQRRRVSQTRAQTVREGEEAPQAARARTTRPRATGRPKAKTGAAEPAVVVSKGKTKSAAKKRPAQAAATEVPATTHKRGKAATAAGASRASSKRTATTVEEHPAQTAPAKQAKAKRVAAAAERSESAKQAASKKKREREEKEATETVTSGLPFLAQAAVHHVSSVPTAHGSKIEALSGRPLPTVPPRSLGAVAGPGSTAGPSLTRSAGVERVLAALKAAVLTLETQPDKRTLTITLKGDPRLAGTALDGLKISVEEFTSAPKQYNITLEASAEAQALLSGAAADMADQLNRLGRERGWSVQKMDVQLGRPLFHRKEAGDMKGGTGGGRGGKTS